MTLRACFLAALVGLAATLPAFAATASPGEIVKATVFGVFCALIATYVGYHAKPTPEGTSVATTQSVVYGSLMVLFLDFLLSATLY